jgi:pimeloyl-ACP methyl ester carboxylesterase
MRESQFKTQAARTFTERWIDAVIENKALTYEKLDVETSFGITRVLSVNHHQRHLRSLVYVPGARTCGAFLTLSDQLQILSDKHRIYLLDVVGQVGMSSGMCPPLKDASYGVWLGEVCRRLGIERGVFVGASFGGQIIMKYAGIAPESTEKIVLMNPIGFSHISYAPLNLYRTLAPVIFPSRKRVESFLNQIVFTPRDGISAETKDLVADFVENAVKGFQFAGEYPSKMSDAEIRAVSSETHLILGEEDGLIPHRRTAERARKVLPNLGSIKIMPGQGHGIEVSRQAVMEVGKVLQ